MVLYELLAGKPPFQRPDLMALMITIMTQEPEGLRKINPQLPREIEIICLKCLEKDPARRYQTMKALADDLKAWLEFLPISATPPSSFTMLTRDLKRRPARYLSGVVVLLTLIALAVFALLQYSKANFAELAGKHSHTLSKTVSREIQSLIAPAEPILNEMNQWGRLKLVDLDNPEKLAPLLAERLRFNRDLAWLSYSDAATGNFTGAQRDEKNAILINHSEPKLNEGRPVIDEWAPDGKRTHRPPDPNLKGYDPRIRPFFRLALDADGLAWTEPYTFFEGVPGITAAFAVRNPEDQQPRGVFTVDFSLAHLVDALTALEKEYQCRMYLVDQQGRPVLKPGTQDEFLTACWQAFETKYVDAQASAENSVELKHDGHTVLAYKSRFELPGRLKWYLITAFQREP